MNPPENVDRSVDSPPPFLQKDAGRVPLYQTQDVLLKYIQAVEELGLDATPIWDLRESGNPQKIAEQMNVPGITSDIVVNHLMDVGSAPPHQYLWTKHVRLKFRQAVKELGLEAAPISNLKKPGLPQQIAEQMNVPGITSDIVAIHFVDFRNLRSYHDNRSKKGINPPEDIWAVDCGYTFLGKVKVPENSIALFGIKAKSTAESSAPSQSLS